jgi:TolB-like protein
MVLRFGDCELDRERCELSRDGELVAVEPRAMAVLLHLMDSRERVVSRAELLDTIWGDRFVSESALSSQIKAIRRAVGDTGDSQRIVRTVHGQGYRFVADVQERDGAPTADLRQDAAQGRPVVGVLPFSDLSPASGHSHLARGLRYDVIAALSKHRWLRVLTSSATAGLAGSTDVTARLRSEFGVRYAVEGAIRVAGDRLRVFVQLTDTESGVCLWADRFDRGVQDVFEVLDEITETVAATVEPEVGYAERNRSSTLPRTDLETWDLFHLGLERFFRFTREGNREAQRMLARCRELDAAFPDAHAWWAYAVVLGMVYWDTEPADQLLDDALAATRTALRADGQNAVFHVLDGRVQLARREYDAALAANERALALNPTFAAAYCGVGDSLCYEGRYEESVARFNRAVQLGSHDPQLWAFYTYGALALLFAERYEEAVDWTLRASAITNCQYWTTAHRAVALARSGRADDAARAVADLLDECPGFSIAYARDKLFYLKRPEQRELYLTGLRAAGVPEGG